MDELKKIIKFGYHNYEIGNIEHCIVLGGKGIDIFCAKRWQNGNHNDEACELYTLLMLAYMTKEENPVNVEAIEMFRCALHHNIRKTMSTLQHYQAQKKWFDLGLKEFNKALGEQALVSLKIADILNSLLEVDEGALIRLDLHLAAFQGFGLRNVGEVDKEKKELLNNWFRNCSKYMQSKEFDKGRFFFEKSLSLLISSDNRNEFFIFEKLEHVDYESAFTTIRSGFRNGTANAKKLNLIWKDIAAIFLQQEQLLFSILSYKISFEMTAETEIEVKRNLTSNMSLVSLKLHKWNDAKDFATECIRLDPRWDKGYYRLGLAYKELKNYKMSMSTYLEGLQKTSKSKVLFIVEILKMKEKFGLRNDIPSTVSSADLSKALKNLYDEDAGIFWKILDKIIATNNKSIDIKHYSLQSGLEYGIQRRFLEYLINHGSDVNKVCNNLSVLQYALNKELFEICAILLHYGAVLMPNSQTKPCAPILTCTEIVLDTGKANIMKHFLKMETEISSCDHNGNTALHLCCVGECCETKITLINMLLRANIKQNVVNKNGKKALQYLAIGDARIKCFNKVNFPSQLIHLSKKADRAFANGDWLLAKDLFLMTAEKLSVDAKYKQYECKMCTLAAISFLKLGKVEECFGWLNRSSSVDNDVMKETLLSVLDGDFHHIFYSKLLQCIEEKEFEVVLHGMSFLAGNSDDEEKINECFYAKAEVVFKLNHDVENNFEEIIEGSSIKKVDEGLLLKMCEYWCNLGEAEMEEKLFVDAQRTLWLVVNMCTVWTINQANQDKIKYILASSFVYMGILDIGYTHSPVNIKSNKFFKKAAQYNVDVEKGLFKKWDEKIRRFSNVRKYEIAGRYAFNKHCVATLLSYGGHQKCQSATDVALCFVRMNRKKEAIKFVEYALKMNSTPDITISKQWKHIAENLELEQSIQVLQWALKCAPLHEKAEIADLNAKLSTAYRSIHNNSDAIRYARESIDTLPSYQGYYELGCCQEVDGCFDESWKTFEKSFTLTEDFTLKSECLARLLKVRRKSSDRRKKINLIVRKVVSTETFQILYQDHTRESWEVIEDMFFYSSYASNIVLDKISLSTVIKYAASEKLVLEIIKRGCIIDSTLGDPVKLMLAKSWFDAAAFLICFKSRDLKLRMNPLLYSTKMVHETGEMKLVYALVKLMHASDIKSQLPSCLIYCCDGQCSEIKIQLTRYMVSLARDLHYAVKRHIVARKLVNADKRWSLICPSDDKDEEYPEEKVVYKPSSSINTKKKKKKTKKKKTKAAQSISNTESSVFDQNTSPVLHKSDQEQVYVDQSKEIKSLIENLSFKKEKMFDEPKEEVIAQGDTNNVAITETEDDNIDSNMDSNEPDEINDQDDLEELTFDGLAWEVECTRDTWNVLRDKKLDRTMKRKIIRKIKKLASGEWPRDIAKRLENVPHEIKLYEAKINKGSRILWERAVSFSARCSMSVADTIDAELGAVYADKIRIWNIALQHDDVPKMIENIIHSHKRGQTCLINKNLKGFKEPQKVRSEKLPNIYINENYAKDVLKKMSKHKPLQSEKNDRYAFFPPASPNQQEYHILKFYAFTSAMASRILSLKHSQYDFPFQVSELEHTIINLEPDNKCSILLLGRSGTGKTTCCLYRLWSHYLNYWKRAQNAGPWLPKYSLPNKPCDQDEIQEEVVSNITVSPSEDETEYIYPCLCVDECRCESLISQVWGEDTHTAENYKKIENSKISGKNMSVIDEDKNSNNELHEENSDLEHLRQLLITKNDVLCSEIKDNFCELCRGSGIEFVQEKNEVYKNIRDIPAEKYPLFITTKDLLLLLDASLVGDSFFKRDADGNMLEYIQGWGKHKTELCCLPLVDEDEDMECEENTEKIEDDSECAVQISRRTEVTYDVFSKEIWPKISKEKKNDCHPSLVWMEIKSFIKGCVESFLNETGILSMEEYQEIGRKRAPNFTGDRESVYAMFSQYEKAKKSLGYFDEMDVHFNIYKRLKKSIIPDWGFHQVYVDETQDFTQAELLLLLRCSLNPNAMFFSGDTAQSIINGVAFRFCDLRSLFVIAKRELEYSNMPLVAVPKKIHQLTHNYRSHSGILQLASVIVQYLKLLFPESFDHLRPDVGLFPGPKPVILDTSDFSELAMLLQGSKRETSAIEFGAHQVVLVQNEKSKANLPAELSYGLVLSIYEAKGLEFDDVLLYNFFKDSEASEEWRVIATNIDMIEDIQHSDTSLQVLHADILESETRPLEFNRNSHKLLNAELKKFYTAVTRARVHVWIFDEDKTKRGSMFEMLIKKSLVRVVKLDKNFDAKNLFAEKSTQAEWKEKGMDFYTKKRWELALKCSERAEDEELRKRCEAQIQGEYALEKAREWNVKRSRTQLQNVYREFEKAAKLFLESELVEEAKVCLKNSKQWCSYARICEKQEEFGEAGKFYKRTGNNDDDALRCFEKANNIMASISLLTAGDRYIECLMLLQNHKLDGTNYSSHITSVADKASNYYYQRNDFDKLEQALSYLEFEDKISFLYKKDGCEKLLLQQFRKSKRLDLAVEYLMQQERYLEAAEYASDDFAKADCLLLAARKVVDSGKKDPSLAEKLNDVYECLDYSYYMCKAAVLYSLIELTDKKDEDKYTLLSQVLSHGQFEEQRRFLQDKDDCEQLLLNLFKTHDRSDLSVQYLKERHRFIEAADVTNDALLKTECLLIAARNVLRTDKIEEKSLIAKKLESAYSDLVGHKSVLRADSLYYRMCLLDNLKHVTDAVRLYDNAENVVGKLLCFDLWQKKKPDCIMEYQPALKSSCLKAMVNHVAVVLRSISHLLDEKIEDEKFHEYYNYFGFDASDNTISSMTQCDLSSVTYFSRYSDQKDIKKFSVLNKISTVDIRKFIAKVLFNLLKMFVIDLRNLIKSKLFSVIMCSLSCAQKNCGKSHVVPDLQIFLKGKQLVINFLNLQYMLLHQKKVFQAHFSDLILRWLDIESDMDISNCVFDYITGFIEYLHIPHLTSSLIHEFFKYSQNASHQLALYIRRAWKVREEKGIIDVNFYYKIHFLSFMIDKSNPVVDELMFHATDEKSRAVKKKYFFNVLKPLSAAISHFYRQHNVINALKSYFLMVTVPIRETSLTNPTLNIFCSILEVPLIVIFTSLAALKGKSVIFPESLMQKNTFFDQLYSKSDQSGFEVAVRKLRTDKVFRLSEFFKKFYSLLIDTNSNFNAFFALKNELQTSNQSLARDVANEFVQCSERLLVIYLTVLSNIESLTSESGKVVIQLFQSNKIIQHNPLCETFNEIGRLNNSKEAQTLLQRVLETKKDRIKTLTWSPKHSRLQSNLLSGKQIPKIKDKHGKSTRSKNKLINDDEDTWDIISDSDVQTRNVKENTVQTSKEDEYEAMWKPLQKENSSVYAADDEADESDEEYKVTEDLERSKKNVAATTVQNWWKNVLEKREKQLLIRKKAVTRLQKWWRELLVKIGAEAESKEKFKNDDNKKDSLKNEITSTFEPHQTNHLEYMNFSSVQKKFKILRESFENLYKDPAMDPDERYELDKAITGLSMKINIATHLRHWNEAGALLEMVRELQKRNDKVKQQLEEEDMDEKFEEFGDIAVRQ
ncbi:uncharacterized protein LOC130655524 isoform X2 [Hydractinia symbiolongicarpus]|uniref:uncharacterized protein LOC130655524 isoform X2 n=1 Tax=Hydractinia symbiolongicarpus TaxID=13093 RepID=UPI002551AD0A|nr:uncharacterized protein LOC130655524 isoform X2 [Hydractinia symbiolongicarpus]